MARIRSDSQQENLSYKEAIVKILISPISLEEAHIVWEGGADIIDIKNIKEGSLGASFPWIISSVVESLKGKNILFSATLGDLPYKPGTASLAARGAVISGANYIKAGLYDIHSQEEGIAMMEAIRRTCKDHDSTTVVVAAGYADYRRFGGLAPLDLVAIAQKSRCDLVMVDTAIKDGSTLFDALTMEEIDLFIRAAHDMGLQVALAGSVKIGHISLLKQLNPDVIGVRGAVCGSNDRKTGIELGQVKAFVQAIKKENMELSLA